MKPYRIAFILPDLRCGGVERMSVKLANYWLQRGYNVTIVCLFQGGPIASQLSSRANCIYLGCKSIKSSFLPLMRLFRGEKFDFVIARMWPLTIVAIAAWMAAGMKSILVVSEHTNLSASAKNELHISPFWIKLTVQLFYRFPSKIVAVSCGIAEDLISSFHVSKSKIAIIYNPAMVEMHSSSASRDLNTGSSLSSPIRKISCDQKPLQCLAVGSLKEQKGFDVLIRAFSAVISEIDARLIIAGDGYLRGSLQELIDELNLCDHVSLIGHIDNLSMLYKSSDLFVLSSAWEGFGNVLVEALSYGLPIVSTNCDYGPSEILHFGRYGRLVNVGSSREMARAIVNELTFETSCYEDRIARAKEFSVEVIASQYLSLSRAV